MNGSRQNTIPFFQSMAVCLLLLNGVAVEAQSILELSAPVDVEFVSRSDGSIQRYVVQKPANRKSNQPINLLIALHGHGSDRWQFINDARGECRASRDMAAKYGMLYVSPDYRAKTSWMGPAAEADLLQLIDDLNSEYRINHVILSGGSMGATSALAFAAMHPHHIDAVVAMNGTANMVEYTHFLDAIAESYGGTKEQKPEVYRDRSAEFFAERLTVPIALTTGGQDQLVPPDSVLRLANRLEKQNSPVRLIHRPEGGHQTSYDDAISAFEFVAQALQSKSQPGRSLLKTDGAEQTVVCLGDSVTGVYYHTGGKRAYPEVLELAIRQQFPASRIKVINAGISGNTTQDGLARLDQDVLRHHPNLVTISFGLNDMVRVPPDMFRSNLIQLVQRCREQHSNVVLDTPGRPNQKLISYCDIIRSVGHELNFTVCDQFQAGEQLKQRAPRTWRLSLSDEIHPNMDGHKRMAELLCQTITGEITSTAAIRPPRPILQRVKSQLSEKRPVRVLAMKPYDTMIGEALKGLDPTAVVEVTEWNAASKSLPELESDTQPQVKSFNPYLVVLATPGDANADTEEQAIKSYSWIMNWSLSFGHQEWDCIVVHPAVLNPTGTNPRDALFRQLVWAQHLELIVPSADQHNGAQQRLNEWIKHVDDTMAP